MDVLIVLHVGKLYAKNVKRVMSVNVNVKVKNVKIDVYVMMNGMMIILGGIDCYLCSKTLCKKCQESHVCECKCKGEECKDRCVCYDSSEDDY